MVALFISAGREMAPLLREHKTWLEANLTASTGEIITMQEVNAYWEGLIPELMVKQLTMGDYLQIDSALMRVDLLGSIKARALVFDTLDINQAIVKVPVGFSDTNNSFNLRAYLEFLFGSADIRVRNVDMTLVENAENQLSLHVDELAVQNDLDSHYLSATISVDKKNNSGQKLPIQLIMKFDGDAGDIFSGDGHAYIDFGDEKNMSSFQNFLQHIPNNPLFSRITRVDRVGGKFWASWEDQRIEWFAETSIGGLKIDDPSMHNSARNPVGYRIDFSGKLAGYILTEDMLGKEYFIHTSPGQSISINQKNYPLPVVGLKYVNDISATEGVFPVDDEGAKNYFSAYFPELKLPEMASYVNLFPSFELQDALKKLRPSGSLKNLLITFPIQNPVTNNTRPADQKKIDLLVRANLDKVSVSAWKGAPALSSVDGYIEASSDAGLVEVDSQQGFSMYYPTLYRTPMKYDSAQGRVQWNIKSGDRHIYVGSHDLDLKGDEGELRGAFWLDIPPGNSTQAAELYLTASLIDADVKFRNKYLPYTLNPSLKDWLANSLEDGKLDESGFIYRGTLQKNDPQEQTLAFFGKVKDVRLKFDSEWPVLEGMDGFLLVNNEEVHAKIKKGNFLGFKFSNGVADVTASANQQAYFLNLQADAGGPGNDVLRVLRDTPLKQTFGNVLDDWKLGGDVKGHINLGVRIGQADEPNFQELDLHLDGNDLWVGGANLPLAQLKGDAHYSNLTGLTSQRLDARLWNENELIRVTQKSGSDGSPDMLVQMKGTIDPQAAATWAHLPPMHFFQGDIPVEATLSVPMGHSVDPLPVATLLLRSDMKGVSIDLPEPFKKTADDMLSTTVKVDLWKDRQQYRVEYGHLISASVEQKVEGDLKGDIAINQQDNSLADLPDYLRVRATIDQASLSEWLPVMERNAAFTKRDEEKFKNNNRDQPISISSTFYPVFDLFIKQLMVGSMKLDNMKLAVNYRQDQSNGNYWDVGFQNSWMTGRYHNFENAQQMPEVEFDTVRIGEADAQPEQGHVAVVEEDNKRIDPLAGVIPQDLPALRVHAKQVILKGDDVGDWRYVLKPNKQGVELDDMFITMPGLIMKGMENDHGATLYWYRDGNDMSTVVTSRFSLSNHDGVKNLFGVEHIIEAEKTGVQGTVKWKGSPAMISFTRLQGDLSFSSEKGRFLNSTASTDLMRVINVFNFDTWARRLKLDFADLTKKGVSFDKVSAEINLEQGKVTFDKPLIMEGPSGRFELKGVIDSVQNSVDASLIVTIPVNQNATWIAALAAGLPVAAGVWAVSKIFGDQIDKLSSVNYAISGSLDDPNVKFVSLLPSLSKSAPSKEQATSVKTTKDQ